MATESPAGELGAFAPAFSLPATDGRTLTLDDVRGEQGLVVVFMCNHCPYVRGALPHLVRDAQELAVLGVNVVGISSNDAAAYPDDAFERMVEFAAQWKLPFPYLYDESQQVAHAYGAVCTPECFGYDAALKLRYRGRVDASRNAPVPDARRDLFEAMREIAKAGEAEGPQFPALGCSIKWKAGR
ncbi:thioredoxin family protein [Paraburkholderia saeva]|uniref:Thiol-disulfide oxidoreductase ResA n=1 Tax=Paraburkholderia saeva TaxID=2777537 RepID=A0A9N8RWQ5_9BURK|nr:thioredoxin family protein [Paraburkholderia saeva]CAG4897738.1 Thiol-disulfide oxidoreductase ResA [Paraburkholderia saeva]